MPAQQAHNSDTATCAIKFHYIQLSFSFDLSDFLLTDLAPALTQIAFTSHEISYFSIREILFLFLKNNQQFSSLKNVSYDLS